MSLNLCAMKLKNEGMKARVKEHELVIDIPTFFPSIKDMLMKTKRNREGNIYKIYVVKRDIDLVNESVVNKK
jgi:hypothetical protein